MSSLLADHIRMALNRAAKRHGEIVHYRNRDRKDNRLENLEITDNSLHPVLHQDIESLRRENEALKREIELLRRGEA